MVAYDFLTCGSCQREFLLSNIVVFIEHKKTNCDVRKLLSEELTRLDPSLERFLCSSCPEKFSAAVTLLQHAQQIHHIELFQEDLFYQLGEQNQNKTKEQSWINGQTNQSDVAVNSIEVTNMDASQQNIDNTSSSESATSKGQALVERKPITVDKRCTTVVPKKRKRHVDTKHLKGKFVNRKGFLNEGGTIYIDLDSSSDDSSDKAVNFSKNNNQETSVILQPGSTYSFPMSYYSTTTTSSANKVIPAPTQVLSMGDKLKVPCSLGETSTDIKCDADGQEPGRVEMNIEREEDVNDGVNSGKKRRYPTSKPFKCNQCDHSFNQRIHLKKHLSKHTGIKPYKCQQCDYSTVERSHLKVHIRIHTGEKPFKCTHCEYATAQNSTLKIHLKRHHSRYNDGISCSVCGIKFPQPELLNNHEREHQASEDLGDLSTLAEVCVRNVEAMKAEAPKCDEESNKD